VESRLKFKERSRGTGERKRARVLVRARKWRRDSGWKERVGGKGDYRRKGLEERDEIRRSFAYDKF
jgi:hypothetical protein